MFGQATLDIPQSGTIGPSHTKGLSDTMAMTIGRTAAWTLSEDEDYVIVTLESGSMIIIGLDTLLNKIVIGRLNYHYQTYQERDDYGT